jgi:hypothetical protein
MKTLILLLVLQAASFFFIDACSISDAPAAKGGSVMMNGELISKLKWGVGFGK